MPDLPATTVTAGHWTVVGASAAGAAHPPDRQVNQDAWRAEVGEHGEVVVAVSDGHGDHRHFRSERGSRLAVEIACRHGLRWARAGGADREDLEASVRDDLVAPLWRDWVQAARDDAADEPFSEREQAFRGPGDDTLIAYGATLLVGIAVSDGVVLAQIGDGDVVAVAPDGGVSSPVPGDPLLDGRRTTSLCQPHAPDSFRVGAVDAPGVLLVLFATDGYGNSQVEQVWEPTVGEDFARYLTEHGAAWVGEHLPDWVAACASLEGSGDDTTVAVLVRPEAGDVTARAPGGSVTEPGGGPGGVEEAPPEREGPPAATPAGPEAERGRRKGRTFFDRKKR
ncbi:MAG: protein phosphatase 2C domain-containing protein [Acidimicrobiales bacterium]